MLQTFGRRVAWTIVLGAAFAFTTWSLYVLANGRYHVPAVLAGFASTVYDGAAILALDAWATAAKDPRQSTLRPRLAAVTLLATSVMLNIDHAVWKHQGAPAAVMFAAPGMVLWAMAELRLSAQHATARQELGLGFAPRPAYGIDAWLVRGGRAWRAYTAHLDHRLDRALPSAEPEPGNEVVLAADQEQAAPALVQGGAPQINGPMPGTLTAAIQAAQAVLGADAEPAHIAKMIQRWHNLDLDQAYIRNVQSRLRKEQDGMYP